MRISYIHTLYLYHIHFPLLPHSSQIYSHFPTAPCILFYKRLMNPICAADILKGATHRTKSIYQRLCPLIKLAPFLKRHQLPIAPQLGVRSCEPLHTPHLRHVRLCRQAQLLWVCEYSRVATRRSFSLISVSYSLSAPLFPNGPRNIDCYFLSASLPFNFQFH